jgi:bacillithiol biosynthesis deacetylase BshB1
MSMDMSDRYDLISFGAHPDDVEVGSGGVLLKMAQAGFRTGIVYLTRGEMGSGGDPHIRAQEALDAAKIMQTDLLETLDLGDSRLVDTPDNRTLVAGLLRRYRPRIVLAPWPRGGYGQRQSHADHLACGRIVMNARYYAGFRKLPVEGEPYQLPGLFFYFLPHDVSPSFVADISEQFEGWLSALKAHRSQFLNPNKGTGRDYLWHLETMARWYGSLVGCKYGQAFKIGEPMAVDNLFCLIRGGLDLKPCPGSKDVLKEI